MRLRLSSIYTFASKVALTAELAALAASLFVSTTAPDFYRSHREQFYWTLAAAAFVYVVLTARGFVDRIATALKSEEGDDDA